jgi:hypothetical protein
VAPTFYVPHSYRWKLVAVHEVSQSLLRVQQRRLFSVCKPTPATTSDLQLQCHSWWNNYSYIQILSVAKEKIPSYIDTVGLASHCDAKRGRGLNNTCNNRKVALNRMNIHMHSSILRRIWLHCIIKLFFGGGGGVTVLTIFQISKFFVPNFTEEI